MSDSTTTPVPPARLALRPRDSQGRIVPAFVATVDGEPDHGTIRTAAVRRAHEKRLCFYCDLPLNIYGAFVAAPLCAITRVSPEPPSHRTCAEYAVQACPVLTTPGWRRQETGTPETPVEPDGIMYRSNPSGVWAVYVTDEWSRQRGRMLFSFHTPYEVTWWIRGRRATYPEAFDGLASGVGVLQGEAAEGDNPDRAYGILDRQYARALTTLPGGAS